MDPKCVVDVPCNTGENPLWHPEHELLYWCDIPPGHLFRFDPSSSEYAKVYDAGRAIGGFTIQTDGSLLLFEAGGHIERWDEGDVDTVLAGIPAEADSRFNDVIADPEGGVFAGTMPTDDRLGRLYHIAGDGSYEVVDDGFDIPNGMAFTEELDTLYVVESEACVIHQYDYDRSTETLSNHQLFHESVDTPGVPDGLTIDANGNLWCARWNGNALYRYDEGGNLKETVEFPVRKVASVTFGGPDYRDCYVTTAGGDQREADGETAGSLFRIRPDVKGREEFRSDVEP